jgi:hypothetical protein
MPRHSITDRFKLIVLLTMIVTVIVIQVGGTRSSAGNEPAPLPVREASAQTPSQDTASAKQTETVEKPEGCIRCHGQIEPMHKYGPKGKLDEAQPDGKDALGLTCTACHGGNPAAATKEDAHVRPRFPDKWKSSANPERTNTLLARESQEFVRFINPGDLRVAQLACGECHQQQTAAVARSMMTHGGMLWGAALYNNGGYPIKDTRFGESYSEEGDPQRLIQVPQPSLEQMRLRGFLQFLDPLPPWEISQPGNILRVFERGGRRRLEVGLPDREEDPGKPDKGLSPRGFGTLQRTDPVYLGIQKTRLLDPTLNFLGTNDHPGDYRSSGCTACHVVYANDRNPQHAASYSKAGNLGQSQTADTNIPKNESGHPIKHQFTLQIPTSQCMTCHMHPGTNMVATYLGLTWWDNETDGDKMYPAKQHNPSQAEEDRKLDRNPEGASLRGKWSEREFLAQTGTPEFNSQLQRTQFADFHGHGWVFRSVFKRNRQGDLLDAENRVVAPDDPSKFKKAVHLNDIHLEKGMHCVDCHFRQDSHGDYNLYNEPRAAIEIGCIDCHGTTRQKATLFTSGPAAADATGGDRSRREKNKEPLVGRDLKRITARGADGDKLPAFQIVKGDRKRKDASGQEVQLRDGDRVQNSLVEPGRWWRIPQTVDTITEGKPDYNWKSRYAKTIQTDNQTWGDVPQDDKRLAHRDANMTCFACHSSWVTGCFGCHLSMQANRKMPNRHNEGGDTRNFTTYNFQVLRDDIFMLGRDGTVTGHKVAPVRSSSAVLVSSQNQNREWIYSQQQTVSAEGFSGQTFNTHVPHTVRGKETKDCSDCHVSEKNDNNAWMAQLLLQGTNFVNFMGRYVYIAATEALEVVAVTERTEPQAVMGSTLHKVAYPDEYNKFVKDERELHTFYEHVGNPKVLQVQLRGEYAYVAAGEGGLRIYDVAQIDQKGFSERITTAPVSRFGQKLYLKTKYATAVAAPSTLAVDPARWRLSTDGKMIAPENIEKERERLLNEEQPIHPLYAYLYVVDRYEGLILTNAATLLDGDPLNNYLKRALTNFPNGAFNPNGALDGANNITIAGTHAYITTDKGLVILDINDPLNPKIVGQTGAPALKRPRAISIQFRYGFIVDDEGLKVLDVTSPEGAHLVEGAIVRLSDARDVYVARTYAYVANGKEGIAIINVENPERPGEGKDGVEKYNAEGRLNDAHQVKVAMTNASLFAYVADGRNGLRILQLTSPETMPTYAGFSPRPAPTLIATFKTKGEALGVSKGLDRDRAADESGNQVAVFGRRGARPFTLEEMQRMFLLDGQVFKVPSLSDLDRPPTRPGIPKGSTPAGSSDTTPGGKQHGLISPSGAISRAARTAGVISGLSLLVVAYGLRRLRRSS